MTFFYYVLGDRKQLWIRKDGDDQLLHEFSSRIDDIFLTPDAKLLVVADQDIYITDDTGAIEKIRDDVSSVAAYNPRGLLSFRSIHGRSYLLDTTTLTFTDVTIVKGSYHEPSLDKITDSVLVAVDHDLPDGIVRGTGFTIETGKVFDENRWFPPYVFILSIENITAMNVETKESIILLEKEADGSLMYNDYIHYEDGTLAVLSLTASGNPTVRLYDNIPYGSIITPDHYIFTPEGEDGKYRYYNLKDLSTVDELNLPSKAYRIVAVEDYSYIAEMLGGGVLASLIGRYL